MLLDPCLRGMGLCPLSFGTGSIHYGGIRLERGQYMPGIDLRDSYQPTFCVKERATKEFLGIIAEFASVVRDRLGPVVL